MDTEATKDLVTRYYEEVLNAGDLDVLGQIAVEDYEEHDPLPGQGTGREGLRTRVEMLRSALGQQFTLEDVIVEGNRVAVRWSGSGKNAGDFMGIPATGKSFTIAGIDVHRIQDGRMAEHWHVVDQLGLLLQLGIISLPAPE